MQYLSEIISFIVGAISGGVAVRFSMRNSHNKIDKRDRSPSDSNRVEQHDVKAGGDVVGRDKRGK